ncbi:MAG: DEAD/DEAH box helicase, partial [Leucothrix sp.]
MPITNPLLASVTTLKGVGPKMAENLQKLDIHCLQDLLFHLPSQYQDRTRVQTIATLQGGRNVLVEGTVEHTEVVFRGRRMMLSRISDGTGTLTLRFFYFGAAQQRGLSEGVRIRCFGEIRQSAHQLEMIHPEYTLLNQTYTLPLEKTLTALYPTTKGLQQRSFRRLIAAALKQVSGLPDFLPEVIRRNRNMPELLSSIKQIHQPDAENNQALLNAHHPGIKRLAFEELLAHQLSLRQFRLESRKQVGIAMPSPGKQLQALKDSLPFTLTQAQQRVIQEIQKDLIQPIPMSRLVQGDVGSGKTLVAAAAALHAIEAGYQVALMAPTEILAEQHLTCFRDWFEPL